MRGRQTQGMLKIIGLPELIVQSTENFFDLAVKVATQKNYNKQLRVQIAERKSTLFNQRQPTAELARILESLHAVDGQKSVLKKR